MSTPTGSRPTGSTTAGSFPTHYLVCASQRSGSTLLVESLAASGVAGVPQEFFQYYPSSSLAPQPREWFAGVDDPDILDHLDATDPGTVDKRSSHEWRSEILTSGRTPNGVWGGKLMWNQTPLLVARSRVGDGTLRSALRWFFDDTDPVFVHVSRNDLVGQAVSMWRAVQTRVWRDDGSHPDVDDGAKYHAKGIAHLAGILAEEERCWREWFATEQITPIEIEFLDLITDPTKHTAKVLTALRQDPALAPGPPLKPQSNSRSKEWAQRYRDDAIRNGYPL